MSRFDHRYCLKEPCIQHLIRDNLFVSQCQSYDDFLKIGLPQVMEGLDPQIHTEFMRGEIDHDFFRKFEIRYRSHRFERPKDEVNNTFILPRECNHGKASYNLKMTMDIQIVNTETGEVVFGNEPEDVLEVGEIPLMTGSSMCVLKSGEEILRRHIEALRTNQTITQNVREQKIRESLDQIRVLRLESERSLAGRFYVRGTEKVFMGRERLRHNRIFGWIKSGTTESVVTEVQSTINSMIHTPYRFQLSLATSSSSAKKAIGKYSIAADIRSFNKFPVMYLLFAFGAPISGVIDAVTQGDTNPEFQKEVYAALNSETIILELTGEEHPEPEVLQRAAINVITKAATFPKNSHANTWDEADKIQQVRKMLTEHVLPHVPDVSGKVAYICEMIRHLILLKLRWIEPTDRDSFRTKCTELAGPVLTLVLKFVMAKYWSALKNIFVAAFEQPVQNIGRRPSTPQNTQTAQKVFQRQKFVQDMSKISITNSMRRPISTGESGYGRSKSAKAGMTQTASKFNRNASISHARRSISSSGQETRSSGPRQIHSDQHMKLDVIECSEGKACGLTKNQSMVGMHTPCMPFHTLPPEQYRGILLEHLYAYYNVLNQRYVNQTDEIQPNDASVRIPLEWTYQPGVQANGDGVLLPVQFPRVPRGTKVFIDGTWVGVATNPINFVMATKMLRRHMPDEYKFISVAWLRKNTQGVAAHNHIFITTESGRLTRPALIVHNNALLIDNYTLEARQQWRTPELLSNYCIEYVDCDEELNSVIAPETKEFREKPHYYTHVEIHPSCFMGVMSSQVPFSDHNQSPRNAYQASMAKQTVSQNHDMLDNMDVTHHELIYGQKPLCQTAFEEILGNNDYGSGVNVTCVIRADMFNQEDSVRLCEDALHRGLFHSLHYRTYGEEQNNEYIITMPHNPTHVRGRRNANISNFESIQDNGIPHLGATLKPGDAVISRILLPKNAEAFRKIPEDVPIVDREMQAVDVSVYVEGSETVMVDRIIDKISSETGHRMVKVRTYNVRVPEIGDKFSSRHGQKGTFGMPFRAVDGPQCIVTGIVPDLIVNPCALPSRMTIGHPIEMYMGVGAALGVPEDELNQMIRDATAFAERPMALVEQIFLKAGLQRHGRTRMIDGKTGRLMECDLFQGVIHYQRLKHMSEDKIHARAKGPVTARTNQPTEGRSREGGLRFGEMERDNVIAHGVTEVLDDRLNKCSDHHIMHACQACGFTCAFVRLNDTPYCTYCQNGDHVVEVAIPYVTRVLLQELEAAGLQFRLVLTNAPGTAG